MASLLSLDRAKVHSAPIGVNLDGHAPAPEGRTGAPVVGYLARVAPEKGLHLLAEAYRILRQERGLAAARLEVAGYLGPQHRGYLEDVRGRMRDWGLEAEFRYHGSLDRAGKLAFLRGLDVLSVPSPYAEPKGLYVLEALASGVPCVQPRHGAFPEVLARTDGGVFFEPHDVGDLADRLLALTSDREGMRALGLRGAAAVRRHHSIANTADRALELYASFVDGAAAPALAAVGG